MNERDQGKGPAQQRPGNGNRAGRDGGERRRPAGGGPGGGRGDRGDRGYRGGPGRGSPGGERASREAQLLGHLRDLEKPLTNGDYALQKTQLTLILDRLRPMRLPSIDALEFDARTRLFTALLRAGRQTTAAAPVPVPESMPDPVPEPTPESASEGAETSNEGAAPPAPQKPAVDREQLRRDVLGLVGDIWRALSDDRRAAMLYAAAGKTGPAMALLQGAGEWSEAAELLLREGKRAEAARLLEQKGEKERALAIHKECGDLRAWLRLALQLGKAEEAREAARRMPLSMAREQLLRASVAGGADLYMDLLAGRGEWLEIANLYRRSEQHADAAIAFERAGKLVRAADSFREAGDEANALRCARAEAEARAAAGDRVGAGELLRGYGDVEKAVELVLAPRPELAFRWLQDAKRDAEAVALAAEQAKASASQGKPGEAARWLERSGELPLAAESYEGAGRFADAARLFEQLGSWERAAECAAKAGERERALQLFRRAGVAEPEARAEALLPAAPIG